MQIQSHSVCPKLGVTHSTTGPLLAAVHPHPITSLPVAKLLQLVPTLHQPDTPESDNYLILAALVLHCRISAQTHPITPTPDTLTTLYAYSDSLVSTVTTLSKLPAHRLAALPTFSLTKETATLAGLENWLSTLNESITGQGNSYWVTESSVLGKLAYMTDANTPLPKLAKLYCQWAKVAARFPTYPVETQDQYGNPDPEPMSLADYWCELITAAVTTKIPAGAYLSQQILDDYSELVDHLETELIHGTPQAAFLMKKLRVRVRQITEFLTDPVTMLTESATQLNPLFTPPARDIPVSRPQPPIRADYPNSLAYLRAKAAYQADLFAWEKSK